MTPQERARSALRYQNRKNRAQGALFEEMINGACDWYRAQKIADIEKTPEPMQPTKDLGCGKFIAHYVSTAQPDYKGYLMGGQAVCFEAKYTDTEKMTQDRVTEDQTEHLERAYRFGAYAFVLCSFGAVGFYRIPWETWRDMKAVFGRKYITPKDLEPFALHIGGPGVLMFLAGLEE